MSKHSKIGINGEQIAIDFLLKKGYSVIYRNWRSGKKEIDIIALDGDTVVFAEVKTRSASELLYPEETVDRKKQANLRAAASAFADAHTHYRYFRFDIVSILMQGAHLREVVHFIEAFH